MRGCTVSNITLLSLIWVYLIGHTNAAHADANTEDNAFRQSITRLEDAARTYRAVYNLPPLPEFREAARNAREYIDGCLALLAEEAVPRRRREVAVLMMAQLDLDDRLTFLNGMMALFDAGKIRDYELGAALFPPPRLSGGLVLDTGDRRVVDLLTRVRHDDRLAPYIRDSATRLLSGDAVVELLVADLTLLRHGHLPPSFADFARALGLTIVAMVTANPFISTGTIAATLAGLALWQRGRRKAVGRQKNAPDTGRHG